MTNADVQSWINLATPVAIIVAYILQRLQTSKIAEKQDLIATNTETAAAKTDILNGKVDEVHKLTNDRMSKMVAKVEELQAIISGNAQSKLDTKLDDIKQAITDSK